VFNFCRLTQSCHDEASRFIYLMTSNSRDYLISEDFIPLLQVLHSDIVILIDYILCIYSSANLL
jgi:hypothetical protein